MAASFKLPLPRLPFFKRKESFVRRHSRHDCFIVGTMGLTERRIDVDGAVLELSLGGCLFRPASIFLLERGGEDVTVEFADLKIAGRLMNTRPVGYGVKFNANLTDEMFTRLIERFGMTLAAE